MESTGLIIGIICLFIFFLFLMRLFGAWMLRIDEVIKELKEIKAELKRQS